MPQVKNVTDGSLLSVGWDAAEALIASGSYVSFPVPLGASPLVRPVVPNPNFANNNSLRFVTNRGEMYSTTTTAGTNSTRAENRKFYTLGNADLSEIRVVYCGYYVTTANVETPVGNDQLVQAVLEYGGLARQFTFGGSTVGTIVNGIAEYVSDPIFPYQFGLTKFSANTTLYLRDLRDVTSGQLFNRLPSVANMAGEGTYLSNGAASQILATGSMSVPSGGSTVNRDFGPVALLGRAISTPDIAVIGNGDSILAGVNDTLQPNGSDGSTGGGFVQRALINVNGRSIPYMSLAYAGTGVGNFLANCTKRRVLYKYATHGLDNLGTNDPTLGLTPAQTISSKAALWGLMKGGDSKIYHVEAIPIFPRATGAWTNLNGSDQTPVSGFELGGTFRDPVNAAIVAALASGAIDDIVPLMAVAQNANDPSKWVSNGTATYATADGTHPSPALSPLLAAALAARAATWS